MRNRILALWVSSLVCLLPAAADGRGVSFELMKELMQKAKKDTRMNYDHPNDGCYLRAHEMGILAKMAGIEASDVVKAHLKYPEGARFRYHIATAFRAANGKWFVADPLAGDEPLTLSEWKEAFARGNEGYKATFKKRESFYGDESVRVDPYDPRSREHPHYIYGLGEVEKILKKYRTNDISATEAISALNSIRSPSNDRAVDRATAEVTRTRGDWDRASAPLVASRTLARAHASRGAPAAPRGHTPPPRERDTDRDLADME